MPCMCALIRSFDMIHNLFMFFQLCCHSLAIVLGHHPAELGGTSTAVRSCQLVLDCQVLVAPDSYFALSAVVKPHVSFLTLFWDIM